MYICKLINLYYLCTVIKLKDTIQDLEQKAVLRHFGKLDPGRKISLNHEKCLQKSTLLIRI